MNQNDQEYRQNPREKANFFSIISFYWTLDIFKRGYSKELEMKDLYKPLTQHESAILGSRLEKNWENQLKNKNKKPSLAIAIARTFWREYSLLAFYQFSTDIIVRLISPVFLGLLINYFSPDSKISKESAYFYATMLVILTIIGSIMMNQFMSMCYFNGMKIRVATCSLIYRKSLKLSTTALGNTSVGKVVNLLSNDVSRFDIVSVFVNSMWIAPILTVIVAFLLYNQVGTPGLIGMLVIAVVTPIQSYTGKLTSKFRLQTALRTDERIRLMDEIINGIQVIKFYAWEKSFKKLISNAREKELKVIRKASYIRALFMTFMLFTTRSALYCTMMAIIILNGELTPSKVFVISSYFQIISVVMSQMFVRGIAELAEAFVAMKRLQNFLEYEEKVTSNTIETNADHIENEDIVVSMKNVTCRWKTVEENEKYKFDKLNPLDLKESEHKMTLQNITVEIKRGILVGVLGHVGSGKSSLLQTLLQELPILSGELLIKGKISYATQEPWIFPGSVRQNITFATTELNKIRYDSVVQACALKKDFETFSDGDETPIIGERGTSLSGGQKARLSLARALYRNADIYLLDDVLSAVDSHVGKHLFEQCISSAGLLGRHGATRILVTHQIHFLKNADWLLIMEDGKISRQGHPNDLMNKGIDISKIAEQMEEQELIRRHSVSSKTSLNSEAMGEKENSNNDNVVMKSHDTKHIEESSKGKIKGNVVVNYFNAGGSYCKLGFGMLLFLLTQAIASCSDYFVGYWTRQEERRMIHASNLTYVNETNSEKLIATEELLLPRDILIYIGGILIMLIFVVAIYRSIFFYTITIRASKNLHKVAFNGIISTKMKFFNLNPSGRILNRFSKDLGSIDEWLAKCLLDAFQVVLMGIGSIIVTTIINPMLLLPIAFLFVIFIYIRKYFLKTSMSLKRLEGITKSPAYVHLASTINGLSTVRAFNAQEILTKEFDNHQNSHTSVWFLYAASSQAFGFALDCLCMIFVSCVTFGFLVFDMKSISGASVGLAITQSMSLFMVLQWGIRQSAEVMNQMMAVERVLEYRELEPEQKEVKKVADKNWPSQGKIEFRNVFYRYSSDMEPALKGVSFTILSKEKIGIVGRTGAGKSSLIGAFFRIAELEGDILIDSVDTSTLNLGELRSKISIIPQDPVLFSGTIRRNLDPFDEFSDEMLWKVLEEVKLKDISLLQTHGLQGLVAAGGSNFSVGQRQLICLARAILRNNKILVLDEATANVDPETDALIQEKIREKFKDCTVLTIAHRLNTVMDSDKILVMNFGKVAEFDSPRNLIKKENGILKGMINATGAESKNIIAMIKN